MEEVSIAPESSHHWESLKGKQLLWLTISLSLATFMNVLDTSIANVSIPAIAGDLAVSPNQGSWVITSFGVSTAIALPLTGWLAKRIGEVRLFLWATFLFTLVSWLCGLSSNLSMLIFFRALQGAVAGPMIPLSQSLLLANYPETKKTLATALWGMTVVVAPVFGPILGGWITDNISWPWIFYINIPFGIFSIFVTHLILKNRETPITRNPIDYIGLLLLIIGVSALQIMLDKGHELDWFDSPYILTLASISVVSLIFLIVWELYEANPVVDLTLLGQRNFLIGVICLSLGYFLFFGAVVLFPLWLQTQMGYTAFWAGLASAPIGILSIILSPVVGKILPKIDSRKIVCFSFLIFSSITYWRSTFSTNISVEEIMIPIFFQGLGLVTFFIPLINLILSNLPPQKLASAAGLSNFLRILAGSFGTSLSITFWTHQEAFHHARLTENITAYNNQSQAMITLLKHHGFSMNAAYQELTNIITQQSFMLAINDFFRLSSYLYLILAMFIWLAKPRQ